MKINPNLKEVLLHFSLIDHPYDKSIFIDSTKDLTFDNMGRIHTTLETYVLDRINLDKYFIGIDLTQLDKADIKKKFNSNSQNKFKMKKN